MISIILRLNLLVQQMLSNRRPLIAQMRHIINSIHSQTEPISAIPDREFEWCVDIALLSVSADVNVVLTFALVCQAMDEPWVGVEVEDARFVVCEEGFEFDVAEAVGVVGLWDQLEQVDNVDESDFEVGQCFAEKSCGSERFLSWYVTARRHDEIWFLALICGSPLPDSSAFCAMCNGVFHVEVLKMVLLVGNNDVDVVGAAETVVTN